MKHIRLDSENLTLAFSLKGAIGPEYLYFGPKKSQSYSFSKQSKGVPDKYGVHFNRPLLSTFGWYEHREYSHIIQNADGSFSHNFEFIGAKQHDLLELPILPHGRHPDDGISFSYLDKENQISITIYYSVYKGSDVFSCFTVIKNLNKDNIHVLKTASLQLPINQNDYTVVTFDGCWANERQRTETRITNGMFVNSSVNGSSSHLHNPLTLLKNNKEVYGFNLIYSGNHKTSFEAGFFERINVIVGINDFLFNWALKKEESFYSPEAIFTYGKNEDEIMHHFHSFIRTNLLQKEWANKSRPVVFNNWEGTYFDFNADKILAIAKSAKELGGELFVLDDGWFSNRNTDESSLGDWNPNLEKTGGGLRALSDAVRKLGIDFGIWMEPEMISPNSDLYRKHPEYAMETPHHKATLWRNELFLDLTMPEVKEFVYESVCKVLDESKAVYLKWDYNRQMTEIYGKTFSTTEYFHRYMLAFYEIMNRLLKRYPQVLFEGCAGGGGRYDLGILYYFSQVWTSDDTDPRQRVLIQDSTLVGYPQITMTCHVTASPNHQTGCSSTLKHRSEVALSGNYGYELDPTKLSKEEKEYIISQINFYKEHRDTILFGDVYRLSYKDIAKGVLFVKKTESILYIYKLKDGDVNIKLPHVFEEDRNYHFGNKIFKGKDLNGKLLPKELINNLVINKKYTCNMDTVVYVIK